LSFATLASAAGTFDIIKARAMIPFWGVGVVEATIARGDAPLAGSVTLTLGPLSFVGTIRRGDVFAGKGMYLIAGGADGWGTPIPQASYRGPATRLATLAQDAARLVKESIVVDTNGDRMVGPFVRMPGPASNVLKKYSPGRWWVEFDGTTHIGDRTPLPAPSPRALEYYGERRMVEVSDDLALFRPGQLFASGNVAGTIRTVVHNISSGSLLTEIYLQ